MRKYIYLHRIVASKSADLLNEDALARNEIVVKEITVIGSRCGPYEPVLDMMKKNILQLDKYISGEFALDQASDAFAKAKERSSLKVQLVMT